jgi:hypothetical protein
MISVSGLCVIDEMPQLLEIIAKSRPGFCYTTMPYQYYIEPTRTNLIQINTITVIGYCFTCEYLGGPDKDMLSDISKELVINEQKSP